MIKISDLRAWITANWPIKLTALVLATVLWAVIATRETRTEWWQVTLTVEPPEGRVLTSAMPPIQALYSGTAGELFKLGLTPPTIYKEMPDTLTGSTYVITLATSDLVTPRDIDVSAQEVNPDTITLLLDDVMSRVLPVEARVNVFPDSGFGRFDSVVISPATVTVRGPEVLLTDLASIPTVRLDTGRVRDSVTITVPLDTTELGIGVRVEPAEVQVSARVVPVSDQVIWGVAVEIPGGWESDPSAVIVMVSGPSTRVVGFTRDSVRVTARPDQSAAEARVRLRVTAPAGIRATASPDSVTVRRRGGG
jgi:YbbR domain-containing protein